MRRIRLLGLICLLSAVPAAGQNLTSDASEDTTILYGEVPPVCTVEAETPVALVQLAPGAQDVTNVVYTCNSTQGFSRRVSSQNGGAMMRGAQGIPYLVSQTGTGDLAFPSVSLQTLRTDDVATFPELAIGSSGILRVEVPAVPSGLLAGDYIDTITIEITPN